MSGTYAEAPTPGSITLRPMTAADVAVVLELERELFPHDAWPESFFYDELAQAEPALAAERATHRYWVAEATQPQGRGVIVGYAGMMCVLPLADVQTIAVAPAAQGRGLGTRLLAEIEAEAVRRGAEDLLLEVREDNPAAQRLYLRVGFEQIHKRRAYYPDGGDALIMRKHLADPKPSTAANLMGAP
ncbi:ribosomal protein S18-alanine N-acetyltransferase [Nesterenkonia massiliensis]|uniref:ribosomal protein S18-alanine N-acetyltransferase n=1 Tax=Nesterenkonia massiliensis TaxID=1232429 RepID=UPI000416805F|nr:ribosomal protein S18-alanine N-acetyltransferase [Nesterenkonia massiliensis]